MIRRFVASVSFMAMMVASAAAGADVLADVSQNWARAWQAKKLDAVLALYTPDAFFLNADGSHVEGRPALRSFFAVVLAQYSAVPHLRSIGRSASGDLAYDWGEYSEVVTPVANPAGAIQTHGTYLVILRRVSGRWLISQQMWTGNAPVPVKK
jgi:uncharacterized protein (TIGR02246 family)